MASPDKYEKGISSLLTSAQMAFAKSVRDSRTAQRKAAKRSPGLIESLRMGVLDDYSINGRPRMVAPVPPFRSPDGPGWTGVSPTVPQDLSGQPARKPGLIESLRMNVLDDYSVNGRPSMGDPNTPIPPVPSTPAAVIAPTVAAPEFVPGSGPYAPLPPGSGGIHSVLNPLDPNAIRDVVDAAPVRPVPEEEGWPKEGWLLDWLNKKDPTDSDDEFRDTRFTELDAMTGGMVDPRTRVLPPDADGQEVVPPTTDNGPPPISSEGLPGASSETVSGGLTIDQQLKRMEELYPDLDFSNPKQAEADANARRDVDRTFMLAQLSMAAGLVSGAGPSWEGIGQGFANYGGVADKGFQKYQQALQDSADRYAKQQEATMAYDTARRQAALGLYTSEQDRLAASQTELWKAGTAREWDEWKFNQETDREARKLSKESIDKHFQKLFDGIKFPEDTSTIAPEVFAELRKRQDQLSEAWAVSLRKGEIVPAGDHRVNVRD